MDVDGGLGIEQVGHSHHVGEVVEGLPVPLDIDSL
jgi:hypothetical protein